jgi:hypothetical protein
VAAALSENLPAPKAKPSRSRRRRRRKRGAAAQAQAPEQQSANGAEPTADEKPAEEPAEAA